MIFHSTPAEHVEKLRRITARLEEQGMHADDMDDFCKTAWHLVELVEKDANSTREMRKRASRLRADPDLILCEHAANAEKHGKSKAASKVDLSTVEIKKGYGVGRYGPGLYGVGEQSIIFKFDDGTERSALDFAATVLKKWERVLHP